MREFASSSHRERSFLAAWGAQFAVLWLAIAAVFFLFYVTMPRTAWNDPLFSPADRSGLAGLELLLLAGLALAVSLVVSGLGVVSRHSRPAAVLPALGRASVFASLWLVGSVYIASWLTFRSTGIFLDPTGVTLFQANPGQMIQHVAHMDPVLLVLLPAAATLFAVLAAGLPARVEQRLRMGRTRRIAIAMGGLAVLSGLTALRGDAASLEHVYRRAGPQRTGPAIHLVAQVVRQWKGKQDPIARIPPPVTEHRPIVPMASYLTAVDPGAARRWNVIVLVIESLRPDQLVAFGGPRSVMPTVDSVADESQRFEFNYTQASHSDYADVAILSSHYPLRSAGYHIYPEDPTYPRVLLYDVLEPLGYRVGVFSSQNEDWGGMRNYLETGSVDRFLHAGSYDGDTYVPRADDGFYQFVRGSKRAGKIDDRFTVGEAVEWIGSSAEPFFLYMNLQNSHVPYEVPLDFEPVFGSGYVTFPISFGHFPRDSVAAVKDMYANSLAYVDVQVARLVKHLRDTGQWERTLLVLTGDTGQAFFEHGFAAHANALYDEVMRVPLIIHAPGREPKTDVRLSQHIDIPPTVLGLLGLPPHPSFQGIDLLEPPHLSAATSVGRTAGRSAFLVGQAIAHQYAIVHDGFKLIYDAREGSHLLFDLVEDPGESTDLSADAPEVACRLGLRLHAWRRLQLEYYGDPRLHSAGYPPVLEPEAPVPHDPENCRAMAE